MSDLKNIAKACDLAADFIQGTWQRVVMGAEQIPQVETPQVNKKLREIYANSIVLGSRLNSILEFKRRIYAAKEIAEDLEYGKGPWDMKPMLLGGPKARMSKSGSRYNIIPFRHQTTDNGPNNTLGRTMPKDILKLARQLKPGGKLYGTEILHPPGQNKTSGYQHKAGLYEGLMRVRKQYEKMAGSKYLTFRMVSTNSDPKSWIHPGYKAQHIAEGVSNYCKPIVEGMIRDAAEQDLLDTDLSIGMTVTRK